MIVNIMRHGKVDGPPALYGTTDIACSTEGFADMEKQATQLSGIDTIISSPRIRCLKFAEALSIERQIPLHVKQELAEISFGDWDGLPFDDMQKQWPDVEKYLNNPAVYVPPNGESIQDFYARISAIWQKILEQYAEASPVLVCHGAVIRMIIAHAMQFDYSASQWFSQLDIRYASISKIQITKHKGQCYTRVLQVGAKIE